MCKTPDDASQTLVVVRRTLMLATLLLVGSACGGGNESRPEVPLADLPLTAEGIGPVSLGVDPDTVIAELTPVLGGPSTDTDWLAAGSGIYGDCPLPLRVISWGSLTTFHTGGPEAGEMFAYSYGFDFEQSLGGVDERNLNLTTPDGIGLGSAVAELRASGDEIRLDGDETIDVWTFAVDPDREPHLRGQVSGLDDADTVLFIETSTGCS